MANTQIKTRILLRNDVATAWTTANPVLMKGEIGIETDTNKFKIGDGTTTWSALPYVGTDIEIVGEGSVIVNAVVDTSTGKLTLTKGKIEDKDIILADNYIFTAPVGTVTIGSSGSTVVEAQGKTLKEFLSSLFAKEQQPVITNPSAKLTYTGRNLGPYEPGELVTGSFDYTLALDSGKYQFGPTPTGVTAQSYSLTYSSYDVNVDTNATVTKTATLTTQTGSIPYKIIVGESSSQIKITASSINYSAGQTPKTNLGNVSTKPAIAAGSASAGTQSHTIQSSRKTFYGSDTFLGTADLENPSANIRALTSKFGAQTKLTIKTKSGDKRLIVAVPSTHTLTEVIDVEGMGLNVAANFQTLTMPVYGANNRYQTDYTVFVWEDPAGIAAHTYNFTIK